MCTVWVLIVKYPLLCLHVYVDLCLLSRGESYWRFETRTSERGELWKWVRKLKGLRKKPCVRKPYAKTKLDNLKMLCVSLRVRVCVLKVYIQYIHSCLCWVDCFITLMKHSYTGCQMCSPVSIGEMSPCPRLRFFHQKRKWKRTLLAWGREGLGRLLEEVREKREGERERGKGEQEDVHIWICSMGTFTEQNVCGGDHFRFIGRRRRAGRWQQAERVKKEMLTVSYETNSSQNRLVLVGLCPYHWYLPSAWQHVTA